MNSKINHLANSISDEDAKGKTMVYNLVDKINGREIMEYKEYKYLMKKEALIRKKARTNKILSSLDNQMKNLEEYKSESEAKIIGDQLSIIPTNQIININQNEALISKLTDEIDQANKNNERLLINEKKLRMFYEDKIINISKMRKLDVIIEDEKYEDKSTSVNSNNDNLQEIMSEVNDIKKCIIDIKQNEQIKSSLIESVNPVAINIIVNAPAVSDADVKKAEKLDNLLKEQITLKEVLNKRLEELNLAENEYQTDMRELTKYRTVGKEYSRQSGIKLVSGLEAIKKYYLIESRVSKLIEECEKLIPETINFEKTWKYNLTNNGRMYAVRSLIEYYRQLFIKFGS